MNFDRVDMEPVLDLEGGLLLSKFLGPVNGEKSVCQGGGGEVAIGEVTESE
jgi:hypothetical protein